MFKVRMKDVALVAFAGGLLAFELVSLGEALPRARNSLADHGLSGKASAASASAAGVRAAVPGTAGSTVSQAVVEAVTGHAHQRLHVVRVKNDGSCAIGAAARSLERLREVEQVVDLALRHATL